MKKSWMVGPALAAAITLMLAGCAEPPSAAPPPTQSAAPSASSTSTGGGAAAGFKACIVSDSGGFDDRSFNQTSYKGLTDAKTELGIETGQVESTNTADFARNIQSMIDADCKLVVTVGFLLGDATVQAAKQNTEVEFAIVDYNDPETFASIDNLKPLQFNTAESSFLAGYLAAGMSETKKVGTFGGAKIPTVTIFMDGFAQGVAYYNQQKNAQVQTIGWDAAKQDGQFVPGDTPFENVAGGKQIADNLVSQGADIVFPVAGPAGEGALQAAKASGGKVNAIWVDTDGCISAEEYCANLLSSVYKAMDVAVKDTIVAAAGGTFSNEPYVGTLANDGTGLSPFNDFESKVPAELKTELETIKGEIESGAITIESKVQPK